jgi:hypothetical protein
MVLQQLCEVALQRLEAEKAAADAGLTGVPGGPGSVRYADFSRAPCTLG